MSIVTKTGDKGKTGLYRGKRVSKDDIRIEVCGSLDELCSFLGLAKSLAGDKKTRAILEDIQRDVFLVGSEVATETRHTRKLKSSISPPHICKLEEHIERMERNVNLKDRCFVLPGDNAAAATVDIARAVARRVERRLVTFSRKGLLRNAHVLVYLNRLSDLLFILSRSLEKRPKKLSRV
jgi:cob(I)alamin adenosyltransferase